MTNGSTTKTVVSVCESIQKRFDERVPCSGPGIAICQIQDKKTVRVLGMLGQKPEVLNNGTIRIVYPSKYETLFKNVSFKKIIK